jgi:predicted AlkP superfamily phosphohydrolase/phosphomutase
MTVNQPSLILIAIDGGDHRLIQNWVKAGYLPTIASLMEKGCWAKITGSEYVGEHGTSLSLISGISRAIHGYYYFRQLTPKTYNLQPYNFADTSVLPFWSYLKNTNKKIAIVDAPDSVIVRDLQGIQVVNWAVHEAAICHLNPQANPPQLLENVGRIFGSQINVSEFDANASFATDLLMYNSFLERIAKKGKLCRELCQQDNFDLISIGFYESHTAAHRFWRYRQEVNSNQNQLSQAIRDIYQAIDREIGLLLEKLPSHANIVIYSAFGMEDSYPTTELIPDFCQKLGYHVLQPTSENTSLNPLTLARRFIPQSWRKSLSNYFPLHLQERLLNDNFANNTNWQKTRAFAIPSLYTSFIRVNLQGRELQGIVQPGQAYYDLLNEIETNLQQLIDPITQQPAIKQIAKTVDWFNCDIPDNLPDIFIEWQPAQYYRDRLLHPQAEIQQSPSFYHRDSYHSLNGFMTAAGESIDKKGQLEDIDLLDLAPSFLKLLQVAIPKELSGKAFINENHKDVLGLKPNYEPNTESVF